MSKYYKAEDVERLIENILNVMIGKEEPIETALCELPTIEIVRCKDCKHYVSDGGAIMECEVYEVPTEDNHYCSYGERIEE